LHAPPRSAPLRGALSAALIDHDAIGLLNAIA
jgi:hypothetical protein